MIARLRPRRRRDDGASAVEFALVLPILIMLVFGIIAFGFVFAQSLSLGNSSREAARLAVVQQRTCAQILAGVQSSASTLAMDGSKVSVEVLRSGSASALCAEGTSYSGAAAAVVPCQGSTVGDELTVIARYQSELIIPLVTVSQSFGLKGQGVFRCEFS